MAATKTWEMDMKRCVTFGSDEVATMVRKNTRIAASLKKVILFLKSTHSVAHWPALAALWRLQ